LGARLRELASRARVLGSHDAGGCQRADLDAAGRVLAARATGGRRCRGAARAGLLADGHRRQADETRAAKQRFGLDHSILLDPTGAVGHAYGATNTPHMFVIDSSGVLAYRGAIDNSPDGEGESPTGGKLVNYVDQALDDLAAKRPVSTPETKAYGCGVKYR
jgi:hypothetical protein